MCRGAQALSSPWSCSSWGPIVVCPPIRLLLRSESRTQASCLPVRSRVTNGVWMRRPGRYPGSFLASILGRGRGRAQLCCACEAVSSTDTSAGPAHRPRAEALQGIISSSSCGPSRASSSHLQAPRGGPSPAPTVAPQWTGFGYFHGESTFLVQRFLGLQPLRRADPQCCRHSSDPDESPSEKGSSLVAGTAHSAICSPGLVSAGCPIRMVLSPLGSDPLS